MAAEFRTIGKTTITAEAPALRLTAKLGQANPALPDPHARVSPHHDRWHPIPKTLEL